jgi:hypothetical protein
VEASEDLVGWPVMSPIITGDGTLKQWTDSTASPGMGRFYRVIVTETP